MFTLIGPQHTRHSSGFEVYVADRENVAYEDATFSANIQADLLASIVPLYMKTLAVRSKSGLFVDDETKFQILERLKAGLTSLGVTFEVVNT